MEERGALRGQPAISIAEYPARFLSIPLRPCRPNQGTANRVRSSSDSAAANPSSFQLLSECHGLLVVLDGHTALQPEPEHVRAHLQGLLRSFLFCIQLHRLAYVVGVEHDGIRRASPTWGSSVSSLLVSAQPSALARFTRPRVIGVAEEAAAEQVLTIASSDDRGSWSCGWWIATRASSYTWWRCHGATQGS